MNMKKIILLPRGKTLIYGLVIIYLSINLVNAKDYHLYYLGGQSNMEGLGYVKELPDSMYSGFSDVMIFHGNSSPDNSLPDGKGIWSALIPGHGDGFKSDGTKNTYTDRFGVELTFAKTLKMLTPEKSVAIIKYSRGGTSLCEEAAGGAGCWEPNYHGCEGINQYDHFLATLRNAFAVKDIDSDGEDDVLISAGIVWMQGESDAAYTIEIANQYEENLKQLMNLIRAALRVDDLPVAIGLITDSGQYEDGKVWDYCDVVQRAQESYAAKDCCAALVSSTKKYSYSDPWHYDTKGFLDLGREFALAIIELQACGSVHYKNKNGLN